MGRWRVHYWQSDQTEVKLQFNNKEQAQRYAQRYQSKHPEDINPPDVYESESDDELDSKTRKLLSQPPQVSRSQRLKELLVKWNRVYS